MKHLGIDEIIKVHNNISKKFPEFTVNGKPDTSRIGMILDKTDMVLYGVEQYKTIYEKAACIMEGICRGHVFKDGNKRTSLCAAVMFLHANGIDFDIPPDAVSFVRMVASNTDTTEAGVNFLISTIATWFEEEVRRQRTHTL